ncbi:amidohydrolase [Thermostichus vulcanus]|uniref:Amidohydrolase n=1 Tax=Thermostichus vulcanus str. 'Rupite' TaxID=2813851 RepID=A0ABT0C9P5_THEVL|nr:amidohydrolase [Thermostichus vulcanus]MCJ2542510.1 amidohydrolase [Thermostichus vulcanus str. 'Rupite']
MALNRDGMERKTVDLLLRDCAAIPMDQLGRVLERVDIAIDGDRIVALGQDLPYVGRQTLDGRDHVALPGLVNAHMHECLTRGLCEDRELSRWLTEICFPLDAAYTPADITAAAGMNQLEMIRSGTTTFIDIYRHPAAAAAVTEQSGLRGIFSPQVIDEPTGVGEALADTENLIQAWHGRGSGRIHIWVGLHAPYSCHPESFTQGSELAQKYGVGLHTHLAETRWEVETLQARYGMTPVQCLERWGCLTSRTLAAHCVQVQPEEIDLLQAKGVRIAHNPSSNLKLASGIAPVLQWLRQGIPVGLGTDSILSNNNLDLFEEMRLAVFLQRLTSGDGAALPAEQALWMATRGSAACLGLEQEIGSLEVGKKADVILLDLRAPHLWPRLQGSLNNLIAQVVYAAHGSDVSTTICDGKILMHNRQVLTLPEEELRHQVGSQATDLCRRAGL